MLTHWWLPLLVLLSASVELDLSERLNSKKKKQQQQQPKWWGSWERERIEIITFTCLKLFGDKSQFLFFTPITCSSGEKPFYVYSRACNIFRRQAVWSSLTQHSLVPVTEKGNCSLQGNLEVLLGWDANHQIVGKSKHLGVRCTLVKTHTVSIQWFHIQTITWRWSKSLRNVLHLYLYWVAVQGIFFITKKLNFRTFSFKDSRHISSSSLFFAYLVTPGDIQEALQ